MKKAVFLFSVLAIFALWTSSIWAAGMTFGVKGGLNIAKLTGDEMEDSKFRMAGAGGVFFCYKLNDIFAVQPEVLFSMKGTKQEFSEVISGIPVDVKLTWKLTYIEVPVLAKIYLPNEAKIKPHLLVGPALGIKASAKAAAEACAQGICADAEEDIGDAIKSTDIGLVAGLGLEYLLSNGCLLLDARYTLGLTSVIDEEDVSVKNNAISVMVGYGFAF